MHNNLKHIFITTIIVLLAAELLFSQEFNSNIRSKQFICNSDTIIIDSLSIVSGSIVLCHKGGSQVPDNKHFIDYAKSLLIVDKSLLHKSLQLKYRIFPINFSQTYSNKDTNLIIKNYNPFATKSTYVSKNKQDDEDAFNNLKKSGSIVRSVAFGNNRDVSTLSNLNLQLSGKINDEVSVLAAIADDNMPLNPDGNTQKIQEFDKIYIKLFKKHSGITLGDIQMQSPRSYFLKLHKQTRGVQMYSDFDIDKKNNSKLHSKLTTGLAKGKYNKLKIKGIEGNQGPYKLTGHNNETYILIVPGSENVYINGRLLKRGSKFDYIINYNSAELIFTSNCLITKDDRITIEYEYTQQLYPNMQLMQNNYFTSKKIDAWLNFYLEKDNKNDPLTEIYTDDIKQKLAYSSNNSGVLNLANVRKTDFDKNSVLYKKIDTICNGIHYDSVYVYSQNPQLAVYRVGFSYIGQNKGNYVLVNGKTNGKVYKWVAPKNHVPQGSYTIVNKFVAPSKKLFADLGANIRTNKFGSIGFEFAVSNFDANTYSHQNKSSSGYALKLNAEQNFLNADTNNMSLKLLVDCKITDKNFKAVENYNSIEFERDWNLNSQTYLPEEKSLSAQLLFSKRKFGTINISNRYMLRANGYKADKSNFNTNIRLKNTQFISNVNYLLTDDYIQKTKYLKHNFKLLQHFKFITLGISEESENNIIDIKKETEFIGTGFRFNKYKIFMEQTDSARNQYNLSFSFRNDYTPEMKTSIAKTLSFSYKFLNNKHFKSISILSYRNVDYLDTSATNSANDNYLVGRQEFYANLLKKSIVFSFFYENLSGVELKKQYQYIEVQSGQGQFTWIDYNNNNIRELDEFETAKFSDQANFIRIFLPSNEYVKAYTTKISSGLILKPYRIWSKYSGFRGFLSMFTNQTVLRISEKTSQLNYFTSFFGKDNNLITKILTFSNNFYFDSKNRKWQLNYGYDNSSSKNLLTMGSEENYNKNHSFRISYKVLQPLKLTNISKIGMNNFASERFYWKNYDIHSQSNEFDVHLQAAKQLSTDFTHKFVKKQNKSGSELTNTHSFKININQNISEKSSLQADFSFILANYTGEINQSISYQMLEGLQKGKNIVWNLSYNFQISKFFHLSLNYSGRKSENITSIHNGSVQLRADF